MTATSMVPYVVGQWVRGTAFYGRSNLIREILDGPRNALWMVGTRRIGKTSLLKELERITVDGAAGFFPLFWDMQGADNTEELHLGFGDALLDVQERLAVLGLEDVLDSKDLFRSLNQLRRGLNSRGLTLLLLCDEVEELINLGRKNPALLGKLRQALQGREGVRSVIASTIKLWALSTTIADTSPFLHGFTPPLYLRQLENAEAEELVRQTKLPPECRPEIAPEIVMKVRTRSDNHPYLTQILAKRFMETGDLATAADAVANDRMVSYFFSVDYEMLDPREQTVLQILVEQSGATSDTIGRALETDASAIAQDLQRLTDLGFIVRTEAGRHEISSNFFRRWLEDMRHERMYDGSVTAPFSSLDSTPRHPVPLGTVADRYELLQRIGEGASAVVFKAHDRLLDTTVAVKQFKPAFTGSAEAIDRLRQETLLARNLAHDNIIRVYDVGSHHERAFITMQWVDGPTLERLIEERAPFDERDLVRIARALADALWCAHQKDVLHRDVKPSNVLVSDRGEPMLGDFGLARSIGGPGITLDGMFLGTPFYASPEQADLRALDGRSDLYSLGVIMFEMATATRPFEAGTRGEVFELHRNAQPKDPRDINPLLSEQVSTAITKCLEKDPARRYQTALELSEILRQIGDTFGS